MLPLIGKNRCFPWSRLHRHSNRACTVYTLIINSYACREAISCSPQAHAQPLRLTACFSSCVSCCHFRDLASFHAVHSIDTALFMLQIPENWCRVSSQIIPNHANWRCPAALHCSALSSKAPQWSFIRQSPPTIPPAAVTWQTAGDRNAKNMQLGLGNS